MTIKSLDKWLFICVMLHFIYTSGFLPYASFFKRQYFVLKFEYFHVYLIQYYLKSGGTK